MPETCNVVPVCSPRIHSTADTQQNLVAFFTMKRQEGFFDVPLIHEDTQNIRISYLKFHPVNNFIYEKSGRTYVKDTQRGDILGIRFTARKVE